MDLTFYQKILVERKGKILQATLNRPDKLNAVDPEMEMEMIRLFTDIIYDDQTQVLVITGAGRAFSAGGGVEGMQEGISNPSVMYDYIPRAKHLISAVVDCPKPIIAKVNGPAMGFGATLALFCDFAIATEEAIFSDPHVQVGFTAGDGGSVIWPQLIGYMRAKRYLMLCDRITGKEAAEIGLITKAVPADQLDSATDDIAQRLANGPGRAIQWTKMSINIGLKQMVSSIMDASMAYEALSNSTQDHSEAVNAILEKRKPEFTGN